MSNIKEITKLIDNDKENLLHCLLQKDPNIKSELELFITIETNIIWQKKIINFTTNRSKEDLLLPKVLGNCIHEISDKLKTISNKNFLALQIMKDDIFIDAKTKKETIEYMIFKKDMQKLFSKFTYQELLDLCFTKYSSVNN